MRGFPCKIDATWDDLVAMDERTRVHALNFLVAYHVKLEQKRIDRDYARQSAAWIKHPRRAALARSVGRGAFVAGARAGPL